MNEGSFYGKSLLHRSIIFACLSDLYFSKRADLKAMASRRLNDIFKRTPPQKVLAKFQAIVGRVVPSLKSNLNFHAIEYTR
ncbi:hypothetical protein HUU05_00730 [candidate division KSB1 bacterium]|nr:hypothetical protein [candidate division KSB1 bacterium]